MSVNLDRRCLIEIWLKVVFVSESTKRVNRSSTIGTSVHGTQFRIQVKPAAKIYSLSASLSFSVPLSEGGTGGYVLGVRSP